MKQIIQKLREALCADLRDKNAELKDEVQSLKEKREGLESRVETLEKTRDTLDKERKELKEDLRECRGDDYPDIELERVERGFIGEALRELEGWSEIEQWRLMDASYHVTSREDFNRVVEHDGTDETRYRKDIFDCDDFSTVMRSLFYRKYNMNSIGTVLAWGETPHAFNVVVFKDGTAELYEPQSAQFVSPNPEKYEMNGAIFHI